MTAKSATAQSRSVSSAAVPAAARRRAAGPGLTDTSYARVRSGLPPRTILTGSPADSPSSCRRSPTRPVAELEDIRTVGDRRSERLRSSRHRLDGQPRRKLSASPSKWTTAARASPRIRAGRARGTRRRRRAPAPRVPAAEVPPGDVAVSQPVLGGAAVALDRRSRTRTSRAAPRGPLDAVDRTGRSARRSGSSRPPREPSARSSVCPDRTCASTSSSAPRSRVTQSVAVPPSPLRRRSRRARATRRSARSASGSLRARSSGRRPAAVARTSPTCLPTHATPPSRLAATLGRRRAGSRPRRRACPRRPARATR